MEHLPLYFQLPFSFCFRSSNGFRLAKACKNTTPAPYQLRSLSSRCPVVVQSLSSQGLDNDWTTTGQRTDNERRWPRNLLIMKRRFSGKSKEQNNTDNKPEPPFLIYRNDLRCFRNFLFLCLRFVQFKPAFPTEHRIDLYLLPTVGAVLYQILSALITENIFILNRRSTKRACFHLNHLFTVCCYDYIVFIPFFKEQCAA